jgi:hypothetical protein
MPQDTKFIDHLHYPSNDNSKYLANESCQSLFSVTANVKYLTSSDDVYKALQEIKRKFEQNIAGSTEPYENLSRFYPSLIEKIFRSSELKQTVQYPVNLTSEYRVKESMLKNQPVYSYKITEKTVLELTANTLPSLPCMMEIYEHPDTLRCLNRTVMNNNGTYNITFLGDSKLRDLFFTLLMETRHLDYVIHRDVSKTNFYVT